MKILCTLVGAMLAAATTARAGRFAPPTTIAAGLNAVQSASAIDGNGNAVVAWVGAKDSATTAHARYRPAGGAWSAPVSLGASSPVAPIVHFNEAGAATVVTTDAQGVRATDMMAGGAWGRPQRILAATGALPLFVMNAAGDAAVVSGFTAKRRAAGETGWDRTETIPTPSTGHFAQVEQAAIGHGGDLLVSVETFDLVCNRPCVPTNFVLYAMRERAPGAGWEMSALAGPASAQFVNVPVMDQKHRAAMIYTAFSAAAHGTIIQAQVEKAGAWGAASTVFSDTTQDTLQLAGVSMDARGQASVALLDAGAANAYRVVDGSIVSNVWGAPDDVSSADASAQANFAFGGNSAGSVALAWNDADGAVRVAARGPSGTQWRRLQSAGKAACAEGAPVCTAVDSVAISKAGDQVVTWALSQAADGPVLLRAAATR